MDYTVTLDLGELFDQLSEQEKISFLKSKIYNLSSKEIVDLVDSIMTSNEKEMFIEANLEDAKTVLIFKGYKIEEE